LSKEQRERKTGIYIWKRRAYSAKPSITSGDRCRVSLPGLDLLLGIGTGAHGGHKPLASYPQLDGGCFCFVLIILYSLYLEYDSPLIPSASELAG